jgi:Fe-S cluster assembly protein SufD
MDATTILKNAFDKQNNSSTQLGAFHAENWNNFSAWGLPAIKHEEWKYTRIKNVFNDKMIVNNASGLDAESVQQYFLPGQLAKNAIVFINGVYNSSLSSIAETNETLVVKSLATAAEDEDAEFVKTNLGHSQRYHQDGINALNAAFAAGGVYIKVHKGKKVEHPVVIYHIADASVGFIFSQPRVLVNVEQAAEVVILETYKKIGNDDSLTNEVIEICAAQDSIVNYIKIQDEGKGANHTGTTHIRQLAKCVTHAVTLTLSGSIVRNNLNMVMEAANSESHMYGLYLLNGETLADNHTIVDNQQPNCLSNELYKGIMDEKSTGVFNGKIFVRQDAQKTNAYQSNKNILIGDSASANTKPQLEIFADDVKCSHGCTIGKLDQDAMFYLKARGISELNARALLLHAFAVDILDQIKDEEIRNYADKLISERLSYEF